MAKGGGGGGGGDGVEKRVSMAFSEWKKPNFLAFLF